MLGQQRLGLGTTQAGLERRSHRDGVDVEKPVQPHEVEADHAGEAVAHGRESAGDGGASAEGDHRDVVPHRDRQHRLDIIGGAGADDDVGSVRQVAGAGAEQVGGRLAAGAQPPGRVVGEHVDVAERLAQRVDEAGSRVGAGSAGSSTAGLSSSPKASSTSPRAVSGRAVAAAGSPQRVGCISGVAVGCCIAMCYSVTHVVTSSQHAFVTATSTPHVTASSTSVGGVRRSPRWPDGPG